MERPSSAEIAVVALSVLAAAASGVGLLRYLGPLPPLSWAGWVMVATTLLAVPVLVLVNLLSVADCARVLMDPELRARPRDTITFANKNVTGVARGGVPV